MNRKNIIVMASIVLILNIGIFLLSKNSNMFEMVSTNVNMKDLMFINESISQNDVLLSFSVDIKNNSSKVYLFKTIEVIFKDENNKKVESTKIDLNQKISSGQTVGISSEMGINPDTSKVVSVEYKINQEK